VVKHIFQACLVWIYTQSNITSITIKVIIKTAFNANIDSK
jgi:hypothetical protein